MAGDKVLEYEAVIGLEVHAQLLTRSKMFCGCSAKYVQAEPNTRVCPVCLGMPGVLPVINRQAVECVIMTGLALNSRINRETKFDRKNYPYPDLMKGYQISQYDMPIASGGFIAIDVEERQRNVGITRVHLEEDVAKLKHHANSNLGQAYSLVDVNRSGTPLMEIVGDPDLRSPEEARQYLIKLRMILRYLGVSTGNMEEGSFRCDANVSVRPKGNKQLFSRVEVKNMNSFRAVYRALEYEVARQVDVVEAGNRVVQETRGWVEGEGKTVSQRTKEYAHDYRYFPEPDLPPLLIESVWVDTVRGQLQELPDAKRERFVRDYGLSKYDATLLTASRVMGDFFEATLGLGLVKGVDKVDRAKSVGNWMLGELTRLLNASGKDLENTQIQPKHISQLIDLVQSNVLSSTMAKDVLESAFNTGAMPKVIVEKLGMSQITDVSSLESHANRIIDDNPGAVQDYLNGKETALKFLMGQVMKATRGKASPSLATQVLLDRLGNLQKT